MLKTTIKMSLLFWSVLFSKIKHSLHISMAFWMRFELSKNTETSKAMVMKAIMASAIRFPLPSSPVIRETFFFSNAIQSDSIIWIHNESLQTGTHMLSYKSKLGRFHLETFCNELKVLEFTISALKQNWRRVWISTTGTHQRITFGETFKILFDLHRFFETDCVTITLWKSSVIQMIFDPAVSFILLIK